MEKQNIPEVPKIFESEYRFCLILWENEPIKSTKLAQLCGEKIGWSKTTSYTVLRRLVERGVVQNDHAVVTSLISKEQAQLAAMDEVMEKRFADSVPDFLAAFTKRQNLSPEKLEEILRIIEE